MKTLMLMVGALLLVGCSTPLETAYTRRTLFNQAIAESNSLRAADKIDASTFAGIVAAEDVLSPVLDAEDDAAKNGNPVTFWQAYSAASPKIADVLLRLSTAKGK